MFSRWNNGWCGTHENCLLWKVIFYHKLSAFLRFSKVNNTDSHDYFSLNIKTFNLGAEPILQTYEVPRMSCGVVSVDAIERNGLTSEMQQPLSSRD